MKQKAGIIVLVAFLVIGGLLVFLKARSGGDGNDAKPDKSTTASGSAPSVPTGPKIALPFLFSTEKEEWLRTSVAEFSKLHPEIDVQLDGKGSLDAVRALLSGEKKPVLWSPGDSLAVNLFTVQWQLAKTVDPLVRDGQTWPRSLLLTPLVFAAWESRAKVLLGKDLEFSWKKLDDAVASKKGWAGLGGESAWGYVKLGHTDPSKSNSGLQALALMGYGFYDKTNNLTTADVIAAPFQGFIKTIEAGRNTADFASGSTGTFMQNWIRQGPSLYDVVVVYEALAISEVPRAVGRWEPIRIFYPNINLWNDHPLCLFNTEWVTPEQKKAAALLADYLMSPPVQKQALQRGYRPGNLDVPVITTESDNPFNKYKDIGIKLDVPRIAAPPDGATLQALIQTYQRNISN
jgi:hypothetical protein